MESRPAVLYYQRGRDRWLKGVGCVVILLLLLLVPFAQADGPEECALCHQEQMTDWQSSPHAMATSHVNMGSAQQCQEAESETCTCLSCHSTSFDLTSQAYADEGVTCQACHGPYVEGHPGQGTMQMAVDSVVCSDCHVQTHGEWLETSHGQAGVQCIGCHRSHTQDLRMDDQYLCESCHQDGMLDAGHVTHQRAQIACVDCHVSPAVTVLKNTRSISMQETHSHSFKVDTETCARCHGSRFHAEDLATVAETTAAVAEQATASVVQTGAYWLSPATLIVLGLGIGIGGMLGIIFILAIGYLQQRQRRGAA